MRLRWYLDLTGFEPIRVEIDLFGDNSNVQARRKYYDAVLYDMVNLGTAELAGVIMTIGIVATAGTNFAFAQQQPCGEQPYIHNVACTPLGTGQLYGAVLVAGIVALAVAFAISGRRYHTFPKLS